MGIFNAISGKYPFFKKNIYIPYESIKAIKVKTVVLVVLKILTKISVAFSCSEDLATLV